MDYLALRERPRQFLALTSLEVAEFDELLPDFTSAWERYHPGRRAASRAPAWVVVEMPHKKPPKRELTLAYRLYNQPLSSLRVVIEHTHSGIKRLRMVADAVRLRGEWRRDTVMVVACGLHNLRVGSPHRAYLAPAPAPAKLNNSSE